MEMTASTHAPAPLRRLIRLLRPERGDIRAIVIYSIGIGGLTLAVPIAVQSIVNTVAFGSLVQPLIVITLMLLVGLSIGAAMRALQTYTLEIMQRRIFVRVVSDLANRLPRARIESFDRSHGPELVNRFFDVITVQKVSAQLLLDGLTIALQGTIGLVVLAFYHPILLAFDIVLLALLLFIIFILGRGAIRTAIEESYAKYAVAGWLEEIARHPLAFKHKGASEFARVGADSTVRQYLDARGRHFSVLFRQMVSAFTLQALASTALLGLGGWLVIEGRLTLGQLVAAELIVTVVVASFAKLGKHLESFYDLMAAVEKLGHLLDLPLEQPHGQLVAPGDGPAAVQLNNVSFDYGDDRPVIRGLSIEIQAGDRVGISGPNGSGKSTLIDLLFGLRAPTSGRIALDGIDYREQGLAELRRAITTIQEPEIFEGTISENVLLGRSDISPDQVRSSLEAVGLLDEVLAMPLGLQTRLITDGAPLSSGQARRLQVARAIAGRPRLLIVDEALDDLAIDRRDQILQSLIDRNAPWTLIVTSHDPMVLGKMDRVIALDGEVDVTPTARHDNPELNLATPASLKEK